MKNATHGGLRLGLLGLACAGVMCVPAVSHAGIVVESVHRRAAWTVTGYWGTNGFGSDTTSTLDVVNSEYWLDYRGQTLGGGSVFIPGLGWQEMFGGVFGGGGSKISPIAMMYSVGGIVQTGGWHTATIDGVLDAVFTLNADSVYDFHAGGEGDKSVTLWNNNGDVLYSAANEFAQIGTLSAGRYRIHADFLLSTNSSNINEHKTGGLWVSVPEPAGALAFGGVLAVVRRRRRVTTES